jgi:hypothetical protein
VITDEQLSEARELAGNRWPGQAQIAISESMWQEWRKSLRRFEHADLMLALFALAENQERFPSLARLIAACQVQADAREKEARPKLTAHPDRKHGSIEEQLEAFDTYAGGRLVGPYEGRVRELIEAGAFQGGSSAEAFAKLQPFTYQVGNSVLTRAFSDTPPPIPATDYPPQKPDGDDGTSFVTLDSPSAPGDLLTPEHVQEIVDAWEMGEEIEVSTMSNTLRMACREEAERRRQAKLQEATA